MDERPSKRFAPAALLALCTSLVGMPFASCATTPNSAPAPRAPTLVFVGRAERFAPDIASTAYAEIRLTISPDGSTALWFSPNRPGGPGGFDIWVSRRTSSGWSPASPVPFDSPGRDFDPAFSPDGAFVYFCSDRPGGLGGDDVYRVAVRGLDFGEPENLGSAVNSAGNEFAPVLSPDRTKLLFSSDRPGGRGRQDLYTARLRDGRFEPAERLRGDLNTSADEFDATFLGDSRTIVFARAPNLETHHIELFYASATADGGYTAGERLPLSVNDADRDALGPMLDWSRPHRLLFTARRDGTPSLDLFSIEYALDGAPPAAAPR